MVVGVVVHLVADDVGGEYCEQKMSSHHLLVYVKGE